MQLILRRLSPQSGPKEQHIAAYALLADALNAEQGIRTAQILRTERGKPYLSGYDLQFSLSHCKGLAICALGDSTPIGIDAEPIRTVRPRVAQRCFAQSELQLLECASDPDLTFTRLWTLKESYVKAIGHGISFPMRMIPFALECSVRPLFPTDLRFTQYLTPDGFVISLCHKTADGQVLYTERLGEIERFAENL